MGPLIGHVTFMVKKAVFVESLMDYNHQPKKVFQMQAYNFISILLCLKLLPLVLQKNNIVGSKLNNLKMIL